MEDNDASDDEMDDPEQDQYVVSESIFFNQLNRRMALWWVKMKRNLKNPKPRRKRKEGSTGSTMMSRLTRKTRTLSGRT